MRYYLFNVIVRITSQPNLKEFKQWVTSESEDDAYSDLRANLALTVKFFRQTKFVDCLDMRDWITFSTRLLTDPEGTTLSEVDSAECEIFPPLIRECGQICITPFGRIKSSAREKSFQKFIPA